MRYGSVGEEAFCQAGGQHSSAPTRPHPQNVCKAVMERVDSDGNGRVDQAELAEWWRESQQLVRDLDDALTANDPDMLLDTVERGQGQVPPLEHRNMDEAKKRLVEEHKKELSVLLNPAILGKGSRLDGPVGEAAASGDGASRGGETHRVTPTNVANPK